MSHIVEQINELKKQKWVDLSHKISKDIPYFSGLHPIKKKNLYTREEDGFYVNSYTLATQYGTHIDAPIHFVDGKRHLDELELKEFVLPLYVIHKEKEAEENHDFRLTKEEIVQYEEEHGEIPKGSFVAFSSGWSKRWDDPAKFYNVDKEGQAHTPGWTVDALRYLHEEREVEAVGHETLDTDAAIDMAKNGSLIGEYYWLEQDKYQLEVLNNLHALPTTGGAIFVSAPNIKGAPGFNARVFAVVPE